MEARVNDDVSQGGALFGVKGHPVLSGVQHVLRFMTGKSLHGLVPVGYLMVLINDKGGNSTPFDNLRKRSLPLQQLFCYRLQMVCPLFNNLRQPIEGLQQITFEASGLTQFIFEFQADVSLNSLDLEKVQEGQGLVAIDETHARRLVCLQIFQHCVVSGKLDQCRKGLHVVQLTIVGSGENAVLTGVEDSLCLGIGIRHCNNARTMMRKGSVEKQVKNFLAGPASTDKGYGGVFEKLNHNEPVAIEVTSQGETFFFFSLFVRVRTVHARGIASTLSYTCARPV